MVLESMTALYLLSLVLNKRRLLSQFDTVTILLPHNIVGYNKPKNVTHKLYSIDLFDLALAAGEGGIYTILSHS